ncbi:hypothetical protein NGM10_09740 [Halorussus salilacus]|uniref:HVO_0234 family beta-propeller protein n=1 Tax=Halorussus salilacus TaxID=2953750 RepID=UPI00209E503A|nr:hypothetical protein [Halorussus salilacus]USZ67010.1 hypothetical protein NGM10_09740 [Halorussus salilacus]
MDISIDEKRVYDGDGEDVPVYVVGEFGVAVVRTSDDLVGEFGLERRCTARDAAGADGRLAVATDEDVLVGDGEAFDALGSGPATAVGFADRDLLVAREDGAILRGDGDDWTELGELDGVRAIDGEFVAAESGVYRATDGLEHAGLDDARDVAAEGVPLAATADGLYKLGNGWMRELDGEFRAVSAGGSNWAHAAGESGLFTREDGAWREAEVPTDEAVVALDHGEGVYAVTEDGTFLLSVGDGWRSQVLGLRGVRAVAAP